MVKRRHVLPPRAWALPCTLVALLFGTAWAEAQSDAAPATVAPVPALRAGLDHDASALAFRDAFLGGALDWPLVVERARAEGVVRWYHWGGSEELNTWIDAVVVPALAQEGIRVESVRLPATRDAVDVVLAEAAAGRGLGRGSVDLIWINGDNFRTLAQADLLFGPFADRVPNAVWYALDPSDPAAAINLFDLGTPTLLRSIPWFAGQYVCFVDTARLPLERAPRTHADLAALARDRPGRFTYVRPPDYIGTAFVQQAVVALYADAVARGASASAADTHGLDAFLNDVDQLGAAEVARLLEPGFAYLRALEPFLLGGGGAEGVRGAPVYPPSAAAWERLVAGGEIDLACEDNVFHAQSAVERGRLPESVRTIVFPEGAMRVNKSFLAIPANAPNPAAALVLADHLSSFESHVSKLELIGYPIALDLPRLTSEQRALALAASPDLRGIDYDDLAEHASPDMHASWVPLIDRLWERWIAGASPLAFGDLVANVLATP
jgi:putative spermidine/putrescine transport system substrate-binding protein